MKYLRKIVALLLVTVLCVCTMGISVSAVGESESSKAFSLNLNDNTELLVSARRMFAKVVNFLSQFFLNNLILKGLSICIPQTDAVLDASEFSLDDYLNFCSGTGDFRDTENYPSTNKWSAGYASESIVPDDFGVKNTYARGSYSPWWYSTELYKDEDGKTEDLRVRVLALNDGSGNGTAVFCSVDCIGVSNTDTRLIRAALASFAQEYNIVSINVSATHSHSALDTQGPWTSPVKTTLNNAISGITDGATDAVRGINEKLLKKIVESSAKAVKDAVTSMETGRLTYAVTDISQYTRDRNYPYAYDGNLYRIMFYPEDGQTVSGNNGILVTTFGCHPESSSYDFLTTDDGIKTDTKISADFVYYMEKVANRAGYDFIFIQGNVGTVTSSRKLTQDGIDTDSHGSAMRFGYELGYIALSMTMNRSERIALNERTGDLLGIAKYSAGNAEYTVWYENLATVTEEDINPVMNIAHEQFMLEIESSMAKVLMKAGLADNLLIYDSETLKYYTVTEVGYMQLGTCVNVVFCPGELYSELIVGHEELAQFPYKPLREKYGENIIVMDLMNDDIGYIEPDNYYTILGYQYDPAADKLEKESWCLLVSIGKNSASTLMGKFMNLIDSCNSSVSAS